MQGITQQTWVEVARHFGKLSGRLPEVGRARGTRYKLKAVQEQPLRGAVVKTEAPQAHVCSALESQGVLRGAHLTLWWPKTIKSILQQQVTLNPLDVLTPKPALLAQQRAAAPSERSRQVTNVARNAYGMRAVFLVPGKQDHSV